MPKSNFEYRSAVAEASGEDDKVTLTGHFSVFHSFYPVEDRSGVYLERIAPGAFEETLRNTKPKVLFEHGYDPQIARKPIGTAVLVEEDTRGAKYSADLFTEASYVRDLLPAIRAGEFGTSFGFVVDDNGDEWNERPTRSAHNPNGLPERTITKVKVHEFSVVLEPANPEATASVRSINNRFGALHERSMHAAGEKVEVASDAADTEFADLGKPTEAASEVRNSNTPDKGIEDTTKKGPRMFKTVEERSARLSEIATRLEEIASEHGEAELPEDVQAEDAELRSEVKRLEAANAAVEERRAMVSRLANSGSVDAVRNTGPAVHTTEPVFDTEEIRKASYNGDEYRTRLAENAVRIIEKAKYSGSDNEARAKADVERIVRGDESGELATKIAHTGSDEYRRAFTKWVGRKYLSPDEQRAMALGTDSAGGFGVPHELDPTIILTSDGTVNPLRQLARVERITGKTLQLVTSAGVTVTRDTPFPGEAVPVTDGSPTLARTEFNAGRVSAYLPRSIEIDAAYSSLDSQLTSALMEAKEDEEAATFVTATGNGLTGVEGLNQLSSVGTVTPLAVADTLTWADIYGLDNDLAPRHRPNAKWLANNTVYNTVRQLDDNLGGDGWTTRQGSRPATINGHDALELSTLSGLDSTTNPGLIYGDWRKFLIVDRIGMVLKRIDVVTVPNSTDPTANVPNGQEALVAFWWNGAGFIDPNAFRALRNRGAGDA